MVGNAFRLPLEKALLVSRRGDTFPLPPPAVELLAFVVRATLRHSWRDGRPDGLSGWLPIARAELAHLEAHVAAAGSDVHAVRHLELSVIDAALFDACRDALKPDVPLRRRLAVRRELARRLDGARQPVSVGEFMQRTAVWIARRFGPQTAAILPHSPAAGK